MKILGFILLAIIAILLIAILVAVVRTILMKPKHKLGEALPVDEKRSDAYAKKLAEMLSKETISVAGEKDKSKFLQFHEILKNMYPNVHKTCEKTELNGNLIFKWKGKSAQKPILFMSHHDVVEANGEWKHPPFCGDVFNDEGEKVVWGRGAVDTKASLMCFMQAAEEMIGEGYVPENDVYLASSCTEELGGEGGPMLAKHLKDKGVHLAMLIDEGGMMMNEPIAGAKGTFAMIGVLEKGYGDVKFIAKGNGGHASAPPKNSPIARLAAFVNSVEKKNPFVSKFPNVVKEMFTRVAPTMPFMMKMIFGNLWLFGGLLKKLMPAISAPGAAMLRTTIAFTMQSGSAGYNVLPQEAYVTANLRYIPHQATDEANEILKTRAAKYNVDTEFIYKGYPTAEVDTNAKPFMLVERTVNKLFPDVTVTPYVMTGGTDARFYGEVCDHCIRFAPLKINKQQYGSIHGLNENINASVLPGGVDFYKAIVKAQTEI